MEAILIHDLQLQDYGVILKDKINNKTVWIAISDDKAFRMIEKGFIFINQ
jgi:hypothetical protein